MKPLKREKLITCALSPCNDAKLASLSVFGLCQVVCRDVWST